MPRVAIPVTEVTHNGVASPAATPGDSTNDHFIDNSQGGRIMLRITSSDAAPQNVTIITPGTEKGDVPISDITIAVPAGGEMVWAGEADLFNQPSPNAGQIWIDIPVNTLSFRAYRLRN